MHLPELIRPKPVIHSLLPLIAQYSISFTYFLKPPLCLVVFWVSVRVVLEGELPIGLLNLLLGGVTIHPQHAIVVSLIHFLLPTPLSGKRSSDLTPHSYALRLFL